MRKNVLRILARQVIKTAIYNRAVQVLLVLVAMLLMYACITSVITYRQQTESRVHFQQEVREHWEEMPDKHPHRMAHYGYIAFRAKHPLSLFDNGVENYTGNAVFLEAHKQNSVNYSEAGFSTGLLRFGDISIATVLQLLVPLVLFFVGFSTIAADRDNGTLKLLFSQGVSWKELVAGKSMGLFILAGGLLLLSFGLLLVALAFAGAPVSADDILRWLLLLLTYAIYFGIVSIIAVLVSAIAPTAKAALVSLIGIWLLFAVVLPRTIQAIGTYLHPSPSRIAFETEVEKDILKLGDSHNPDDPYYKRLKDSVLKANGADSIQQLSFNYSGFQMREGEKMSAQVYNAHLVKLLARYRQQNQVFRASGVINPLAAVKTISMALSGTDFGNYVRFQDQAEAYRYRLAQHMNELQIKLISNKKLAPGDKPYSISADNWKAFPDFRFTHLRVGEAAGAETISFIALLLWTMVIVPLLLSACKSIKIV